jgi:hypothetical protein
LVTVDSAAKGFDVHLTGVDESGVTAPRAPISGSSDDDGREFLSVLDERLNANVRELGSQQGKQQILYRVEFH